MPVELPNTQVIQWVKPGGRSTSDRVWSSMMGVGGSPSAGVLAGTDAIAGVVPTDATAGFPVIDSFSGEQGFVHEIEVCAGLISSPSSRWSLNDLLFKAGSYAFNASQVLAGQPSYASRVPGGDYTGLEIWFEALNTWTGNPTVDVTYTNELGVAGRVASLVSTAHVAGRLTQFPLQDGDRGVQLIASVTSTVATAGDFNILVMRPLWRHGRVPHGNGAGSSVVFGPAQTNLVRVFDDSALYPLGSGDATFNTTNPEMMIHVAHGTPAAGGPLRIDVGRAPDRSVVGDVVLLTTPVVSTTSTSATFTFSATAAAEYSLDGGAYVPATSPIVLSGLADGAHAITIRVIATPTALQSFTWTVGASGPAFPASTTVTTTEALRDHCIALVKAIVPRSLAGDRFTPYRNELGADFHKWAEAKPSAPWRVFQIRGGEVGGPQVSNAYVQGVTAKFRVLVAYSQNHRAGQDAALDRDDLMDQDMRQIEAAIGPHYGYVNFTNPNASHVEWEAEVDTTRGDGVDFLDITVGFYFYRSTIQ